MRAINLFVVVLGFAANVFAADPLTERLQRGLFEEEANRNLDAAIKEYQSVVTQADEQRKVIATALFRLGECYRKLGRTNDATAFYQRIVTDFSEQEALVKLSRPLLPPTASPARTSAADAEMARELSQRYAQSFAQLAELNSRIEAVNKLSKDDLLLTAPALFKDEVLSDLGKRLRASQDRIREFTSAGRDDTAKAEKETFVHIDEQISQRLVELKRKQVQEAKFLEANVQSLKDMLAKLPHEAASAPSDAPAAQPMTQAEAEELARVKTLARNSPDLLRAPIGGSTELQKAARGGHYSVAEFLLSQGAKPNDLAPMGSPMIEAAARGHLRIVQLLLDHGATKDDAGNALIIACQRGFKSVAEQVLLLGVDVNFAEQGNLTALHAAANGGQTALVELLLKNGARPDVLANRMSPSSTDWAQVIYEGATPLHLAVEKGHAEIASRLLGAGANARGTNYGGMTPLHLAAGYGRTNLCALLLDHGANPNAVSVKGYTVLGDAVGSGYAGIVAQLLRRGADVNLAGQSGDQAKVPPLITAVQRGSLELVNVLLAAKPELETTNQFGYTALQRAVEGRQDEIVEKLLGAGANPNHPTSISLPLLWHAFEGSARTVDALLRHGANPNVVNKGETPLSIVMRRLNEAPSAWTPAQIGLGQKPPDRKAEWEKMAASLRAHGADEFLQRRGFISAVRGPQQRVNIFSKGTNDVNRYTLFEFLAAVYQTGGTDFPFPDLAKITIHRLSPTVAQLKPDPNTQAGANAVGSTPAKQPILVNAAKMLAVTNDCSGDVPLEWGDEVEIPMADHPVSAVWYGLSGTEGQTLGTCLRRMVRLVAGGTNAAIQLSPYLHVETSGATLPSRNRPPLFRLSATVLRDDRFRGLLRSSSDLSRVTVTRLDPQTKETRKMTFDLNAIALPDMSYASGNQPPIPWSHDLWLRDGDVIEVPEKP